MKKAIIISLFLLCVAGCTGTNKCLVPCYKNAIMDRVAPYSADGTVMADGQPDMATPDMRDYALYADMLTCDYKCGGSK